MNNGPAGDESTTSGQTPGLSERKRLRQHFAKKLANGELTVTHQELLQWMLNLGALLSKQDIVASAGRLVDALYNERGYQTTEEILALTSQDIDDVQFNEAGIVLLHSQSKAY